MINLGQDAWRAQTSQWTIITHQLPHKTCTVALTKFDCSGVEKHQLRVQPIVAEVSVSVSVSVSVRV
jgi:hypothetical protein